MTSSILPKKFKGRVPVVLNKGNGDIVELEKGRFLVNKETTVGQFMCMLRQKNKISPTEGLFIFCNNVLPPTSSTLLDLWNEHHDDEDEILYFTISKENTFG
jgi:GABA(A) receptor-associated protein